jgi:uncharacterized protein YchJ
MEDKKTLENVEGSVEEDFNSLDWLKNNVEAEIAEEKEIRRKRRNQRKRKVKRESNIKRINSSPIKIKARKLLPKRNEACPCGAMQNGKPVKYKNCCGKV